MFGTLSSSYLQAIDLMKRQVESSHLFIKQHFTITEISGVSTLEHIRGTGSTPRSGQAHDQVTGS
jgi:hypothetical protein